MVLDFGRRSGGTGWLTGSKHESPSCFSVGLARHVCSVAFRVSHQSATHAALPRPRPTKTHHGLFSWLRSAASGSTDLEHTGSATSCLTQSSDFVDTAAVADTEATGFGSPNVQADSTAAARFFCVRSMVPPYGRAVRGAFVLAGSCTRSSNLHGSAHPVWKRGSG